MNLSVALVYSDIEKRCFIDFSMLIVKYIKLVKLYKDKLALLNNLPEKHNGFLRHQVFCEISIALSRNFASITLGKQANLFTQGQIDCIQKYAWVS